ncbi:MAG: polysaccharide pyruvyl transferase family protein [Trueperaceae bacterium]
MRVAHFGTFDVDNYGDLLFPHLVQWRLPNVKVVHVSPTGRQPHFSDALESITLAEARDERFDAVIVGGGNIVHARKTELPDYRHIARTAYASLWLGAGCLASEQKIPLVFNGPGFSPARAGWLEAALIRLVSNRSTYASFRDQETAALASSNGFGSFAEVVPDTAFDLARMWPTNSDRVRTRPTTVSAHVNDRYIADLRETASTLDSVSEKLDAQVRLLAIGPCHGDIETAQKVSQHMHSGPIVDQITSLKDMANAIANSQLYIGSSMHGFITALAYETPALMVLKKYPMRKFIGLLETAELPASSIAESWRAVHLRGSLGETLSTQSRTRIESGLERHWMRLKEALQARPRALPTWVRNWKTLAALSVVEGKISDKLVTITRK